MIGARTRGQEKPNRADAASKHADAESKQLQEKTCKSITLSRSCSCFCCAAGWGGDVFPPRGHLEEITLQTETAGPVKHDSGMNGGF